MTDDGTPTPKGEEETEETIEQYHSILQDAITLKTDFMSASLFGRKKGPQYPSNWSKMSRREMENYAFDYNYVFCAGHVTPHHLRYRRGKGQWRPLKWYRKWKKCQEDKDLEIAELKSRIYK
jgi:hypothetical protein